MGDVVWCPLHVVLNIGFITSVGVHVCATADHLYEEFFGLQCITSYCRIKQQNGLLSTANTRANYLPHL
jgi:hypothetical protein